MDIFDNHSAGELLDRLRSANRVVLTAHRGPDGDAVGSTLAMWNHLKDLGVESTVVLPDAFPEFLNWMHGKSEIVLHSEEPNRAEALVLKSDVLFIMDYNDSSRVGGLQAALESSDAFKVMIDHHQNPSDFVNLMFSDDTSSSTCELVYRLIERWGQAKDISVNTASCIYCGIVTDTGSFRFPSSSPKTLRIAAALCETGMDHSAIQTRVYDNNRVDQLKLVGYAISSKLVVFPEFHAAIISLSAEELKRFSYRKGDTEGLVNKALSIVGVNFAAFIHESSDRVKMSFRSVGSFSVSQFSASHFGGGGHHNAAGGVSFDSLEDAQQKIIDLLPEYAADLDYLDK